MRAAVFVVATGAAAIAAFAACSSDDDAGARPGDDAGTPPTPDAQPPTDAGPPDASSAPPVFFKSGSRLAIEAVRAADGQKFFRRFFDKQLGTPCDLFRTSTTTALCVPPSASLVYADATCTTRAAIAPSACSKGVKYVAEYAYECGAIKSVVVSPLGTALPGTTYYDKSPTCTPNAASPGEILSVGAPLAANALVSFTLQTEPGSAELGRQRWVGSDGTEQVDEGELFDVKKNQPCQGASVGLASIGGAATRCIPRRIAVHRGGGDGPFTDATCTTPAADYGLSSACPTPQVALERALRPDSGTCTNNFYFALHDVGAQVTTRYLSQGANCNPDTSTSRSAWVLGAALPEATFPAVAITDFGAGRVRARGLASNGTRLSNGTLFDTVAGAACSEQKVGNAYYCVAGTVSADTDLFSDAACTMPIVLGPTSCTAYQPPQPYAAVRTALDANGCDSVITEMHPLTPVPGLAQIYRKNGALCEVEAFSGKALAVGPVVDASTLFETVTLVTE